MEVRIFGTFEIETDADGRMRVRPPYGAYEDGGPDGWSYWYTPDEWNSSNREPGCAWAIAEFTKDES